MNYVLAVDGGNTKTVAWVANLSGSILGTGRSGCSDIYNNSVASGCGVPTVDVAIANIEGAVLQALQAAHIQPAMLAAGIFNLAGADWPEDYQLLQSAMQTRCFGRLIQVQNDALGVLHANSAENIGVAVVCGTGAATGARGHDGRTWHSSFWQKPQGSIHLSQQVLDIVLRAELGLEASTILTQRVLDFFGRQTIEEVLHDLTARKQPSEERPRIDGLTSLLLDEAEAGDQIAGHLVRQHGRALGDYATVAARHVGIEQAAFTLVLAGGVFRHPTSLLADAITARVRETSPELHTIRSQLEPVVGVLFTALELAGTKIDNSTHNHVMITHPIEEEQASPEIEDGAA